MKIKQVGSKGGPSLLHLAAVHDNAEIIKLLFPYKPDLNARFEDQTPLHVAARIGNAKVILNFPLRDIKRFPPLPPNVFLLFLFSFSFPWNSFRIICISQVIRALISAGSDIEVVDYAQKTPLAIALDQHKEEAAFALIENGARVFLSFLL